VFTNATESRDRSAIPFGTETRKSLGVEAVSKSGHAQKFGSSDNTLSASPVDPHLKHSSF
jgi:hypothetical protein